MEELASYLVFVKQVVSSERREHVKVKIDSYIEVGSVVGG